MLRRRLTEDDVGLVKCGVFEVQDVPDTCSEVIMGADWMGVLCRMVRG